MLEHVMSWYERDSSPTGLRGMAPLRVQGHQGCAWVTGGAGRGSKPPAHCLFWVLNPCAITLPALLVSFLRESTKLVHPSLAGDACL